MTTSSSIDAVSAVSAVGGSSSYDAMTQAQNAYDLEKLEIKAHESKSHGAGSSKGAHGATESESPAEKDWHFSSEEAHKLYENLCNSFVNQCKQDQDEMKSALDDLKKSTEIGG